MNMCEQFSIREEWAHFQAAQTRWSLHAATIPLGYRWVFSESAKLRLYYLQEMAITI